MTLVARKALSARSIYALCLPMNVTGSPKREFQHARCHGGIRIPVNQTNEPSVLLVA